MSFTSDALLLALDALSKQAAAPQRYVVAFSGGLDSTVLLHALVNSAPAKAVPVLAVHIDHGMQPDSGRWADACAATAEQFGVEFKVERVAVDRDRGQGVEAAAREARYAALAGLMQAGDWLLSAHHEEDQAETLLLNLMRGSGPDGLAGIAAIRPLATGWLARPLLAVSQSELREYAAANDLPWLDDPSNVDRAFDRNFLRHEVLPLIESRWPGAARRLSRSSRIAAETSALLAEFAAADLAQLVDDDASAHRLNIDALLALSPARQKNVLRHAARQLGLGLPPAAQLQRVLDEVLGARVDATPVVSWEGAEVRRFRGRLYLLRAAEEQAKPGAELFEGKDLEQLGAGLGALRLEPGASQGLDAALLEQGLQLKYRQGGEKIKLVDQSHTKTLKNLLQEENIVPWMRDKIPLLYAGDRLVAVADLWLAHDAARSPGVAVHWEQRPPLH